MSQSKPINIFKTIFIGLLSFMLFFIICLTASNQWFWKPWLEYGKSQCDIEFAVDDCEYFGIGDPLWGMDYLFVSPQSKKIIVFKGGYSPAIMYFGRFNIQTWNYDIPNYEIERYNYHYNNENIMSKLISSFFLSIRTIILASPFMIILILLLLSINKIFYKRYS